MLGLSLIHIWEEVVTDLGAAEGDEPGVGIVLADLGKGAGALAAVAEDDLVALCGHGLGLGLDDVGSSSLNGGDGVAIVLLQLLTGLSALLRDCLLYTSCG